jgi:outer membrane autotransporter protein
VHTPAYAERAVTGSTAFALVATAQSVTDTRSELGAWGDIRQTLANGAPVTLRGRVAWMHDFDPDRAINVAFQALPLTLFTVNGAKAPRDAALTSAVAEVKLRNGVTLAAKLDGEFAAHSSTYAGTGTVRYAW